MRTTLAIDDNLLDAAKRRARERGKTVGQVVEDALRRELASDDRPAAPPIPVFHGEGGVRPGIDVTSNRALYEALDDGLPLDQLK